MTRSGSEGREPERKARTARDRDLFDRPLPKRFYKSASAVASDGAGYTVQLDGKAVRTPAKHVLCVPTAALAEALAAEWNAQGEIIDPAAMPLTRIVNSALDAVAPRHQEVVADIASYAGSDLLCYRAEAPQELVQRQHERWDPVLEWAARRLGHRFAVGQGVMPVRQPKAAIASLGAAIEGLTPIELAALHVITTLTGSALLAFALSEGRIQTREAWNSAHVDEDWQILQWGADPEAAEKRARRWLEMEAASRLLGLARS